MSEPCWIIGSLLIVHTRCSHPVGADDRGGRSRWSDCDRGPVRFGRHSGPRRHISHNRRVDRPGLLGASAIFAVGIIGATILSGRGPWGNLYEFSVAFAFGVMAGYLYLGRRYPIRAIGFLPIGVAAFLLGYAFTLPQEISPLVPALDNPPLLTIHVAMAMISYGIFATSFAAGVAYLAQGQNDRFGWLPSHKVLDEVAYRAVIVGFPIFATMIILGSWWASIAWSRYWGWDPKKPVRLSRGSSTPGIHARSQRGWLVGPRR